MFDKFAFWVAPALIAISLALPATLSAEVSPQVFEPSDNEMALIKRHLAEQMLDPESTIISNVVARRETIGGDSMAWVCGNVRGKNSLGGYSQPTPFMGALVDGEDGTPDFILIGISGQSAAEKHRTLTECLSRLD